MLFLNLNVTKKEKMKYCTIIGLYHTHPHTHRGGSFCLAKIEGLVS